MDNRYRTGQVQINVSNDNSTLNAMKSTIGLLSGSRIYKKRRVF